MSVGVQGWRTRFKVEAGDNWLSKAAAKFNTVIISTPFPSKTAGADYDLSVFFSGVRNEKAVRSFVVASVKRARLKAVVTSDAGILALLECKGKRTLEFEITSLAGRAAFVARPERIPEHLDVSVDSPVGIDLGHLEKRLHDIPRVRLVEGPDSERKIIPLEDLVEIHPSELSEPEQLDEKDFEIAAMLLESGYFEVPRPENLSLKSLSERVGIAKPSLIWRMRRLQALGIEKLMGTNRISQEDLKAASEIFAKRLLKKK